MLASTNAWNPEFGNGAGAGGAGAGGGALKPKILPGKKSKGPGEGPG